MDARKICKTWIIGELKNRYSRSNSARAPGRWCCGPAHRRWSRAPQRARSGGSLARRSAGRMGRIKGNNDPERSLTSKSESYRGQLILLCLRKTTHCVMKTNNVDGLDRVWSGFWVGLFSNTKYVAFYFGQKKFFRMKHWCWNMRRGGAGEPLCETELGERTR